MQVTQQGHNRTLLPTTWVETVHHRGFNNSRAVVVLTAESQLSNMNKEPVLPIVVTRS